MSRSRIFRISTKREDKGVAEIVGAILLFAVVISIFTSFMVWYIPAQTSSNEVHYEQQTKSSMGELISQIHSGTSAAGSTISQSVALGISGVSIFAGPQDTQFSILPSSTSFNASLSFQTLLNLTSSSGSLSAGYFNESYSVSGVITSNGNTEYITAINYVVEDGALFQNYGGSEPTNSLGPLPVGIVNNSGQFGLSLSIYGITGQSVSYSSTQAQVVNLRVDNSQSYNYINGSSASLGGQQYTINRITLENLNYSINGTLIDAWNYAFFSQFNSTNPGYSAVIGLNSWDFTSLPFSATISGNQISIASTSTVALSSLSTEYSVVNGE